MFSCFISSITGVAADASGGSTSVSVTSGDSSSFLTSYVVKFLIGKSFTISEFVVCLNSDLGGLKSISDLCSLALAFLPSQSSLDQSEGIEEGCGALYLQLLCRAVRGEELKILFYLF